LHRGNPANALAWSRQAKELFENLGIPMGTAMGTALAFTGEIDAGVEYSLGNWEGVRALGDPIILSLFGHELILTLTLARDVPRAIAWGEKILPILAQASELAAGQVRRPLAIAYALSGKMRQGVSLCQAEEEFESKSLIGCYFESGAGVGLFHYRHGDWDKAKTYLERMKEIQEGRRNFAAVSAASYCLGMMNTEEGDYSQATDHLLESLNICRKGGNLLFTLWVLPAMAELQIKLDKLNVARNYLDDCFELLEPGRNWYGLPGDTYRANGILTTRLEEWKEAEASFEQAVAINRNYGMPWDEAKTHYQWGKMFLRRNARGDKTVAEERFSRALALFEEVEAQKEIEKASLALEQL
jgi:tetratricopeptide (TPR) repeat protein